MTAVFELSVLTISLKESLSFHCLKLKPVRMSSSCGFSSSPHSNFKEIPSSEEDTKMRSAYSRKDSD